MKKIEASDKTLARDDIEKGDQEEQYYQFMKANPKAGKAFTEGDSEGEEDIVYDEQGNATKGTHASNVLKCRTPYVPFFCMFDFKIHAKKGKNACSI